MKYHFIAVYKITGVSRLPDGTQDVVIASFPALKADALLTANINPHTFEVDRGKAIGLMMLKGLFGKLGEGSFEERLERELTEYIKQRDEKAREGVFLVFKAEGVTDSWHPREPQSEQKDFIVTFDAIDKGSIKGKYKTIIDSLLASLAIEYEQVRSLDLITEGTHFINEQGKTVYALVLEASTPTVTVSRSIPSASIAQLTKLIDDILSGCREINNPVHLLVNSLGTESDKLLSFLSVWAGLEIFVSKAFKEYKSHMFSGSTIPSKLVERIQAVMEGKWNIQDMFCLIVSVFSPGDLEQDCALFKEYKTKRDDLMHGQNLDLDVLPFEDTQKLFRKYLRLYAAYKS